MKLKVAPITFKLYHPLICLNLKSILIELVIDTIHLSRKFQGGRSCTGARVAPAEKFGLGRRFLARTYAILSRIKICCDLRTF